MIATPAPKAWPEPVPMRPVLTTKGEAVRLALRLAHAVNGLPAVDRADVLVLLAEELAEATPSVA